MSSNVFEKPMLMRASKVMAHSTARTFVEPFLTYRSYIRVRIFIPLAVYLPLSLSYAMVSLPFKLPFDAKYVLSLSFLSSFLSPVFVSFFFIFFLSLSCLQQFSFKPPSLLLLIHIYLHPHRFSYAAGFFTFAAFIYMGMCALGLALEAMITLLTPRFVPFFLVLLVRRSSAIAPLPLPSFSPAFPFSRHLSRRSANL